MAQFARPSSDINAINWTAAPLWSKVDEVVADDSDIIQAPDADILEYACELGLSSVTDPLQSGGHIVRVRAQKSDSFNRNLLVELYESSLFLIASATHSLTASMAVYSFTLTAPQADSISNYAALSIRMTAKDAILGHPNRPIVSWAEFEVPNQAFEHLAMSGAGLVVAAVASGSYLTVSGGGLVLAAGVEGATALISDSAGYKVHG